jgi:hypothetical protein
MVIGYAIKTLRAEAPLYAAFTPAVEVVLAAAYRNDVDESKEAMACTPAVTGSKDPRLGLQRRFVLLSSGRCRIAGNFIPSL